MIVCLKYLLILLFSSMVLLAGCNDLFLPKDPPNTPIENFDLLWKEFDAHYSFFIYKKINWDSLYTIYRPQITDKTNDQTLFDTMSGLLSHLKDGHVSLISPFDSYSYDDWFTSHHDHFNLDLIRNYYLKLNYTISKSRKMLYGQITPQIGYIYIISFLGSNWPDELDTILNDLNDTKGLIIDIRDNFGGNDNVMLATAGHFTDKKRLFRYIKYRNGPKHDDFTKPIGGYVEPEGQKRFTGNIVVLTNRGVFSAAESFVMAMSSLPYVTTIGDTTGGGSANPIERELPNGWSYSISTWIESTPQGKIYEGTGIPPDITVPLIWPGTDNKDLTLETAINHLQNLK